MGGAGFCGVRRNRGGRLDLPFQGRATALALDPIEKKPLHHFLPGSTVLSVGFLGCNLDCPFCQNAAISRDWEAGGTGPAVLSPDALVAAALESGAPSLAFTYSEPTVHLEYLLEAARLAREAGLATVLVTNGCLEAAPAADLLSLVDAANVDLKSWSSAVYREVLKGDLGTVTDFLRLAAAACHLEVTTLLVPGVSDDLAGLGGLAAFLRSLSPDLVLHLSAYHPDRRWRHPPPGRAFLEEALAVARAELPWASLGNVPGLGRREDCPHCGALLVEAMGYRVAAPGLEAGAILRGRLARGRCRNCGKALPYVVESTSYRKITSS